MQAKTRTKVLCHIVTGTIWYLLLILFFCSPQSVFAKQAPKTDWEFYQQYGHKSPKWDSLVEAGFSTFDGNNFETAVNFFERARGLGCKDGLVLFKLATYKELRGNFAAAIKMLQEVEPALRNRYPKHPSTLEMPEHLGRLFYQMGKYDDALPQFLEAIHSQGENFLRLYLVGQMYRMKKASKEAIDYFEKSLQYEVPPQTPGNLKLLAKIELIKLYFESKEDDKTLDLANQILSEDPQNALALTYRDNVTQRRYKTKERETLKRIIENN